MMTSGWRLKFDAEATKPVSFTTRAIRLRPPASAAAVARAFSAQSRAASRASSRLTSSPTLPVVRSSPSSKGSWPAVKIRDPVRVAGT